MLEHLERVQSLLDSGRLAAVGVASVDLEGHAAYWYMDPAVSGKLDVLEDPLSQLLVLYRTNMDSFNENREVPHFNKSTCEH